MESRTRVLGTFTLAMMTMAAIVSLRNLSLTAELGYSAVFFLILAGAVFFIPIALVIAELAAAWPRAGGCYVWVSEAYGKPMGFIALWLSWMASIAWFPTILAFTATMLGHLLAPIFPGIENNVIFILGLMLLVFWGTTLINFFGIEFSGFFSSFGVILGTLIPGILIIALGIWWWFSGHPMQAPLNFDTLTPDFKLDNISLFAGVLLSLAGVELAAYHVRESKDPQHTYPRAVAIAAFFILFVYIFGSLAIAMVVPQEKLQIASGLIQAFTVFFTKVGFEWIIPLMALFLFLGALAGINAWVIGPAKGMLVVAQDGFFPKWLKHTNKHGVPTTLLIAQAVVGSGLSLLFLYINDNSASIWFLSALSAQFTVVQYFLIFCAGLRLRNSKPNVERPFKAPAMKIIARLGIYSCLLSFIVVYLPHDKLVTIEHFSHCLLLTSAFAFLLIPTLLLIRFRARSRSRFA